MGEYSTAQMGEYSAVIVQIQTGNIRYLNLNKPLINLPLILTFPITSQKQHPSSAMPRSPMNGTRIGSSSRTPPGTPAMTKGKPNCISPDDIRAVCKDDEGRTAALKWMVIVDLSMGMKYKAVHEKIVQSSMFDDLYNHTTLRMARQWMQRVVKKHKDTGGIARKPGGGRPRKVLNAAAKALVKDKGLEFTGSVRHVKAELAALGITVSRGYVHKEMMEVLHFVSPTFVCFLNKDMMKQR
jgi:hypothetical protein